MTIVKSAALYQAALELYRCRSYSGAVAVCTGAVDECPENVALRLLLARALLALRRDVEAQHHLSHCLQIDPRCAEAYFHLGELAMRRDELKSAEIFLREALRIDPSSEDSRVLLGIIESLHQPTAAVEKLPAATAAVGCIPPARFPNATGEEQTVRRAPPQPVARDRARPRLATHGRAPVRGRRDTVPLPMTTADTARVPLGAVRPPDPPSGKRFGEYLVEIGALTPLELQATLAYHRASGVRLGRAACALGFVSEPKVEWAALAFHGRYRS